MKDEPPSSLRSLPPEGAPSARERPGADRTGGDAFELRREGGVAHLVLNRPERLNTMTPAFFAALGDAVQALDAEGATRALVVSSTGKHFSAGMSLDVFADLDATLGVATARSRLAFQRTLAKLMASLDALDRARFPVLCAIQGGCIGGGVDLATACDIRIATRDAFFVVQETSLGMAADLGVLQRLQRIVPSGIAREMAYGGERVGAERALACGLVNAVHDDAAAALAHALAMAGRIAAQSPLAIAGTKAALNFARDHSTAQSLEQMTLLQSAIFDPAEIGRAVEAWKAKRPAAFEPLDGP